jgi:hypothetical protein
MSRREVPLKKGCTQIDRVVVGYDRPLETFFAQAIAIDADGEDVTVIWQGTYPGELPTPRSAIALIEHYCDVPEDLARQLETDRLATLAQADGPNQQAAKRALIIGEAEPPRPKPGG